MNQWDMIVNMKHVKADVSKQRSKALCWCAAKLKLAVFCAIAVVCPTSFAQEEGGARFGEVKCANLIYAKNKTSVCFSDEFMSQAERDANVKTSKRFTPLNVESAELFKYPFAVMTGEGEFSLNDKQRKNLFNYLTRGGFVVASAGCSSLPWATSFQREMKKMFPDNKMRQLGMDHDIFHTVYDIKALTAKRGNRPVITGLEVGGRIVMVFAADGLNDTGNAGPNCCCCGGNEIRNAKQVNVNLLVYALTH